MSVEYDSLYVQFLHYFNVEQDYFECHEVMEELWLEEGRSPLYQGLLQVAVSLYHFQNDNRSGAYKLMEGAVAKISSYDLSDEKVVRLGINMSKLLDECELYLQKLGAYEQHPFDFYPLYIQITDDRLRQLVESIGE